MAAVWDEFCISLAFYPGQREGGQPVSHPDLENQRFPRTVRRYLRGSGAADSGRCGDLRRVRAGTHNMCFVCLQRPATLCAMHFCAFLAP